MKRTIDFLKKNFMKIFLMSITLAGVCMFAVLLANFDSANYGVDSNPALGVDAGLDRNNALGFLFLYIASLTFFAMMSVMIIVSMFQKTKKYNKWVCFMAGALGLTFMLCSALLPLQSDSYAIMREIRNGNRDTIIQQYVHVQAIENAIRIEPDSAEIFTMLQGMPLSEWPQFIEIGLPNLLQLQGVPNDQIESITDAVAEAMDMLREAIEENTPIAIREAKSRAAYEYLQNTIIRVTSLLLYGSLPLVYGLKLTLAKKESKAKEVN